MYKYILMHEIIINSPGHLELQQHQLAQYHPSLPVDTTDMSVPSSLEVSRH